MFFLLICFEVHKSLYETATAESSNRAGLLI